MKFRVNKILSAFLTASLVWIFVGCAFLCSENENCAEDFDFSSEISASFDETSHEDSCPITTSIKTTAPERMIFDFDSPEVSVKVSTIFSPEAISPDFLKHQSNFYRPPNSISQDKRPLVLRI
jgi:hypothetical protein